MPRLMLALLLLAGFTARAASAAEDSKARAHYEHALRLAVSGAYGRALAEFEAAFDLAPERVGILLGIAECHRRLGETAKTPEEALGHLRLALAVYENYLYNTRNREPPPPERSGVPEKLAALQKDIERIEADRDAARKLAQLEAEKQAFVAMRAAETAAQRLQEEKNRQAAEQASRLLRDAVAVGETNRRLQEEQLAEHRRRRRSRKARVAALIRP